MKTDTLYFKSGIFGAVLGLGFGTLIGAITGTLSASWNGVLISAFSGAALGLLTGAITGALTVWTAGESGGVSSGAYTGMFFGAVFGGVLGIFIPESFRTHVASLNILILNVLTQGRFETAVLLSFLVSLAATMVGAWVGGRNLKPRDLSRIS